MPQLELSSIEREEGVALWHITEGEEELAAAVLPDVCPGEIVSPLKRKEWLAGRLLLMHLTKLTGMNYRGIVKDEFGKPFLKDSPFHISLSHSFPYVAAQISSKKPVGIDVEQPNEKLLRIAPRILDAVELDHAGNDVVVHCIYWCAKETLYKIYGKRGLLFSNHLHVRPFAKSTKGLIDGAIEFNGYAMKEKLGYRVNNDFVLVFTKTNDV
ncbi:MAG: 4'-phosphopantetheinyl transferase superfamily protein [Cyclobacteriaceae bacterium]